MTAIPLDPAAKMLYRMEPLRRPVLRGVLSAFPLPPGSRGLDAGCGIGLQTGMLAQAVGPRGRVTGLDASAALLETARRLAGQPGTAGPVSFLRGSWNALPYQDGAFDWVWSMDAAGYAPDGPAAAVQELVRVIRPGGRLVLGFWSSQCLLPGYPGLEARLNASAAGIAPFTTAARPEAHYLNALGWLRQAGLIHTRAETFARTAAAPLEPELREALAELLAMRWGEAGVSAQDWQEYQRLCRPGSKDYLLDSPAYYGFFTVSVFSGVVAGGLTADF